MEQIGMSQQERDWLKWLKRARDGMLTQEQAAEKSGVTDRWVREPEERGRGAGVPVAGPTIESQDRGGGGAKALKVLTEPDWRRTYHEGFQATLKTGTFYFDEEQEVSTLLRQPGIRNLEHVLFRASSQPESCRRDYAARRRARRRSAQALDGRA